ncbi:MAG TPA: ATP-binding protein [Candidatus Sulfopaludibacter sp.]|nr:ATP-binding protein [Candidatus Sulfopaludibacter sp.]
MATVSNSRLQWDQPQIIQLPDIPLESLPFPAAVLSHQGIFILANPQWTATFADCGPGQPFEKWCAAVHPNSSERSAALMQGAQQTLNQNERFLQGYGESNRYRISLSPYVMGALVMHQDFYELGAPKEVSQTHRMEVVGRLVGGVAHDFANLITLIDGYTDLLLNRLGSQDPVRAELEEIRKAANHGAHLTSQLLGFTRGQKVEPQALDLNVVVSEMEHMLRPVIGEYIKLETSLAPGLAKVTADSGQMEQVIVNLILNARDAMPDGGRIQITTSNCQLDAQSARENEVEPGMGVVLTVADTGSGIEASKIGQVFEPFFTTKAKGKGTGLGLSTVRDIVRQSGGCIEVHSEPGRGASFAIWLPALSRPSDQGRGLSLVHTAEPGHETILLVEDEESVRRLLVHLLRKNGYQVLEAANAEEALKTFGERGGEIQLMLTDMVMPGISGRVLAEKILEQRPETRIIFMSGYTDDVLVRTGALSPGMTFLQKPLRPDVLAAKVRAALDSPSLPFNPR